MNPAVGNARRIAALLVAAGGLWPAAAQADYVVRDRAGKRVETVVERPGGVMLRHDPRGRRLGVMEPSAGGYVLRDPAGRRIGTVQGSTVSPFERDLSARRFGGTQGQFANGVVRDRTGRRIGTIERR